mgnify:CR=1 FL=1
MLENLTALVTGASQGIGRQISISLAEEGANVVLAARSDGIYETEESIGGKDKTLPLKTDVTREDSVKNSIETAVDHFGGLDLVVNNAGISGPTAPVEEIRAEDWEKTMDVNLKGAFFVIKHAVPYLKRSNQASIINISSISGKMPLENRTPYTSSKMAIIGLTRTLAFELGEYGVTVNAICPGTVEGEHARKVIEKKAENKGISYEEARDRFFVANTALGKMIDAKSVADQIIYLASENGREITAQDLNVDAGRVWY